MKKVLFLIVVVFAVLLSGCYFNDDVMTDQMGAQLSRNKVKNCVGPGVYTDLGWFADLREVSVATLTFEVEDPEVATSDNQLVGVKITIQARRKGECDSVKAFLSNWSHLLKDDMLISTIDATAREGIKNGTREFTLSQLLDDRNSLALGITGQLKEDAGKYHVDIVNVTVENVAIAPEYAETLQRTARLNAEQDYELRRQQLVEQKAETDLFERQQQQLVLAEQLKVEEANTSIQVEIARRQGEVVKQANEVYRLNQQAFELEKLRLYREIFGDKSVFYFLPEGTDLDLLFTDKAIIPLEE